MRVCRAILQMVPGLKLKAVQGVPTDDLSFAQALQLVRAPERPLSLLFCETELTTGARFTIVNTVLFGTHRTLETMHD